MKKKMYYYREEYFSNMSQEKIASYFELILITKALEAITNGSSSGVAILLTPGIKLEDCIYSLN